MTELYENLRDQFYFYYDSYTGQDPEVKKQQRDIERTT